MSLMVSIMNTGNQVMPPHAPTPEDAEHAVFFIRWWIEILTGSIAILTGLFLKAKGMRAETVIIPMSEEEIEHRMTICKQSIMLVVREESRKRDETLYKHLQARDDRFFRHVEEQDEKMIKHIKDIIN